MGDVLLAIYRVDQLYVMTAYGVQTNLEQHHWYRRKTRYRQSLRALVPALVLPKNELDRDGRMGKKCTLNAGMGRRPSLKPFLRIVPNFPVIADDDGGRGQEKTAW